MSGSKDNRDATVTSADDADVEMESKGQEILQPPPLTAELATPTLETDACHLFI